MKDEDHAASRSLQGQLLIASPRLLDPNFRGTVVLIVRHSDEGAFGLVLNRTTGSTVRQVWSQVSASSCECEEPLRLGGPVEGPLVALHGHEPLADMEVLPAVYFTTEPDKLEELVARKADDCRFFAGYAGWDSGQLERELDEGSWLVAPAGPEHVFAGEDLWEKLRRQVADARLFAQLGVKHVPSDPSLN